MSPQAARSARQIGKGARGTRVTAALSAACEVQVCGELYFIAHLIIMQ